MNAVAVPDRLAGFTAYAARKDIPDLHEFQFLLLGAERAPIIEIVARCAGQAMVRGYATSSAGLAPNSLGTARRLPALQDDL
jgi:hypothetical protein